MLLPDVRARIEQEHLLPSDRIDGGNAPGLCDVAMGASQAQVLRRGRAAGCTRDDVVEMKCLPDENLRRTTVFAPPGRPRLDERGHPRWDSAHARPFLYVGATRLGCA